MCYYQNDNKNMKEILLTHFCLKCYMELYKFVLV